MHHVRRDLRQRLEHEAAPVHLRMRNAQPRRVHHAAAVQNNIQIDDARSFRNQFRQAALASHGPLYRKKSFEQALRRLLIVDLQSGYGVKEPGLLDMVHRLGLIRVGKRRELAQRAQRGDGLPQMPEAVAEI